MPNTLLRKGTFGRPSKIFSKLVKMSPSLQRIFQDYFARDFPGVRARLRYFWRNVFIPGQPLGEMNKAYRVED